MSNEDTPQPSKKLKADWTINVPALLAILATVASLSYGQAQTKESTEAKIGLIHYRQALTEAQIQDMKEQTLSERRDLQIQLREINGKVDRLLGAIDKR